jgi:hypothetical protein
MALQDMFPGFARVDVDVDGARIHAVTAGTGRPLLLLLRVSAIARVLASRRVSWSRDYDAWTRAYLGGEA